MIYKCNKIRPRHSSGRAEAVSIALCLVAGCLQHSLKPCSLTSQPCSGSTRTPVTERPRGRQCIQPQISNPTLSPPRARGQAPGTGDAFSSSPWGARCSAATLMNISARRRTFVKKHLRRRPGWFFPRRARLAAHLGQLWEPGQSKPTPEPFPVQHPGAKATGLPCEIDKWWFFFL